MLFRGTQVPGPEQADPERCVGPGVARVAAQGFAPVRLGESRRVAVLLEVAAGQPQLVDRPISAGCGGSVAEGGTGRVKAGAGW